MRELHRSATTVVHRARRDVDGAGVVIKTHANLTPSEAQLARLRNEFQLLASVAAPTVVRPIALVKLEPGLALVLEDAGGDSLSGASPRPLPETLRIARDVAHGLGALHREGIFHGDIAPGNVVRPVPPRMPDLEALLIDLSHASRLRRGKPLAGSAYLQGALAYASPEQTGRTSRLIDHRTDFYSLGVLLYELLTGALPFTSADPLEIIHAHLARTPTPPTKVARDVPRFVSDLVMCLLEKNPEDRYQSAEGLGADLEACLARYASASGTTPLPTAIRQRDAPLWFEIPDKLYGREPEIAALQRSVEHAAVGEARIVLLTGEPGVGKSTLVGQLGPMLAERHGDLVSGKYSEISSGIPYSAVLDALRALVGQILTEPEDVLAGWRSHLTTALGGNAALAVDVLPELETILGPQPRIGDLNPLEAQARLTFALRSILQAIARPERPLAIFLDDVQWADLGSLQLLESLRAGPGMRHLALILAVRDEALEPSRPAHRVLARLAADGGIDEVRLHPLRKESVSAMLAEALRAEPAEVGELADVCMERCAGNPLLVRELITSLVDEKVIRPRASDGTRGWTWDIAAVRRSPLTENVAKLISRRIGALSAEGQRLLELASCAGNAFRLSHVALAAEVPRSQAARILSEAIAADLVYVSPEEDTKLSVLASGGELETPTSSDVQLSFRHDLVLQAAYAGIPDPEKASAHLRLGRALRTAGDRDVFAVLSHINRAHPRLTSADDRLELARLNLEAGRKAAKSSAPAAALPFLELGLELLGPDAWTRHRELALELHTRGAEAACAAGALDIADRLITAALPRASGAERVELLKRRVLQHTLEGRSADALDAASEALALLGAPRMPAPDLIAADVRRRLGDLQVALAACSIPALAALPAAATLETRLLGEVLATMIAPAYFTSPDHIGWVAALIVDACLRHGQVPASSMGYVILGNIYANVLGRQEEAIALGQLALAMADRFNDGVARCRTRLIFANNYYLWSHPIASSVELNREGFRAGLESGDISYAGYIGMFQLFNAFAASEPLADIEEAAEEPFEFCLRTKNQLMCDVISGLLAVVKCLRGRTGGPRRFDLPGRPEAEFQAAWRARQSWMALCKYGALKAQALLIHGDDEGARAAADEAESLRSFALGQLTNVEALYFGTLARLRIAGKAPSADRPRLLEDAHERVALLQRYAKGCPENFAHEHALVEAELARISGRSWEASARYSEAIRLATAHRGAAAAALASELAARFWIEAGQPEHGAPHLREARHHYAAWGARAKLDLLEGEFPFLRRAAAERLEGEAPGEVLRNIDVASVFKATAVISGSLVESELHERLLRIAVENAGARHGALFAHREGKWFCEAEVDEAGDRVALIGGVPLEGSGARFPHAVINYVRRTKEAVVLQDARHSARFGGDPYFAWGRPVSVVCVPILRQTEVMAVLYLDNDLVPGAFRTDHLEVLLILAGQAAISLESARLYRAAQRAIQVRDDVLGVVAHDLRNPLHAILMQSNILQHRLQEPGRDLRRPAELIHRSAERMHRLIEDLLDVSRLEGGKFSLNRGRVSPRQLVGEVVEVQRPVASIAAVELELDVDRGIPDAWADHDRLLQVLDNLIGNAIKFTPSGGRTVVGAASKDENVLFWVTDTGVGITAEDAPHLFDRFWQAQRADRRGAGLGLTIVKGIVEAHGGRVWLESRPGAGSTFYFTVPAAG